ncbi:MAG: extracellular solute-binding protein [Chloroflexi bacterium]|nr:extracellular solute-binding protein [Chloroflexota bacterium]
MLKNSMMASLLGLSLLVVYACAPAEAPAQIPPTTPERGAPALSAKTAWEEDWERTLREARKEGVVFLYTGYGTEFRKVMTEAMSQKYGIALDVSTGRSSEVSERVMREQKTNTHMADVVTSGTSHFLATYNPGGALQSFEKVLVLPEVVDPKFWWGGKFPWLDPDTKTFLPFFEYVSSPIVINTDLVKAGEVSSWKNLLEPKWKGKMILNDPTVSGTGQKILAVLGYGLMDWDYVTSLLRQEPVVLRDERQMAEWIARGRYPLLIGTQEEQVYELVNAGAPMRLIVPQEGTYTTSGNGNLAHPKGAPHPNAAKIFINFLLSKEGQTLASRATGITSSRIDVPTDHVSPAVVRQAGGRYVSGSNRDFLEKEGDLRKKVADLTRSIIK